MRKSQRRRRKNIRRFETAGALILGRARIRHLPAATRSSVRWIRGLLLLIVLIALAGALWLTLDARFYVYDVQIEGLGRLSPDEVFRASGLPGLHILWVRPAECEARLLGALPTLESAHVACRLPAQCTITVTERQPRLVWNEDGQLWWIDAQGVIFPAETTAQDMPSDGWSVRGPLPRGEHGELDERVRVALAELWAAGVDISPVLYYVPGRGLVLIDERGWRVVVGQGPGMDRRLQVLGTLAADLEARGLTPRFVDVRFAGAPYYSLVNDW